MDFSFTNDPAWGNVNGTVTGQIFGLSNNSTGAATAIYIDSYPAALGSYATPFNVLNWTGGTLGGNSFTITNNVVTAADFWLYGANGINDQLYLNSSDPYSATAPITNFLDIGSNDTLYVWNGGALNTPGGLLTTVVGAPGPQPGAGALSLGTVIVMLAALKLRAQKSGSRSANRREAAKNGKGDREVAFSIWRGTFQPRAAFGNSGLKDLQTNPGSIFSRGPSQPGVGRLSPRRNSGL
ncbi:MAG: hypothetical protein WBS22_07325 [Methylocystis sp.]